MERRREGDRVSVDGGDFHDLSEGAVRAREPASTGVVWRAARTPAHDRRIGELVNEDDLANRQSGIARQRHALASLDGVRREVGRLEFTDPLLSSDGDDVVAGPRGHLQLRLSRSLTAERNALVDQDV